MKETIMENVNQEILEIWFQELFAETKHVLPMVWPIVYQAIQTGEDEELIQLFKSLRPKGNHPLYDKLKKTCSYNVVEKDLAHIDGLCVSFINSVFIHQNLEEAMKLRVLVHEAAHMVLNHDELAFYGVSSETREVVAETVMYLYLRSLGFDCLPYASRYIVKSAGEHFEEEMNREKENIFEGVYLLQKAFSSQI